MILQLHIWWHDIMLWWAKRRLHRLHSQLRATALSDEWVPILAEMLKVEDRIRELDPHHYPIDGD